MAAAAKPAVRCLYDILGVPIDVTPEAIKSEYRKAALRCHPDKNMHRLAEAEAQFKELQHAYQVLSDPEERAWYDSHRDAILRGKDPRNRGGDDESDEEEYGAHLYQYFSPTSFDGFDEAAEPEDNYYAVFSRVFSELAKDELKSDPKAVYPPFGNAASPYDEVRRFYAAWSGFATALQFSWCDQYKANEMGDRFQRRAAERINEKERETARRDYCRLVQRLASWVNKRDPRVEAERERLEAEAAAKEELRSAQLKQRLAKRAATERQWLEEAAAEEMKREAEGRGTDDDGTTIDMLYELQQQEAARRKAEAAKAAAAEGKSGEEGGGSSAAAAHHRCDPCRKSFPSAKLLNEHVASSKHKTKVRQLIAKGDLPEDYLEQHGGPSSSGRGGGSASHADPAAHVGAGAGGVTVSMASSDDEAHPHESAKGGAAASTSTSTPPPPPPRTEAAAAAASGAEDDDSSLLPDEQEVKEAVKTGHRKGNRRVEDDEYDEQVAGETKAMLQAAEEARAAAAKAASAKAAAAAAAPVKSGPTKGTSGKQPAAAAGAVKSKPVDLSGSSLAQQLAPTGGKKGAKKGAPAAAKPEESSSSDDDEDEAAPIATVPSRFGALGARKKR